MIVTVLSATTAVTCYVLGDHPIVYDAAAYLTLAQKILKDGLLGLGSDIRTYGYPAILASLLAALGSAYTPARLQVLAFGLQWTLLVLAGLYGAFRMRELFPFNGVFIAAYCIVVVDVPLLMQSTELLSDSLAATCIFLVLLLSIPARAERRASVVWRAAGAFCAAAVATEIRPSSVAILCGAVIVWTLRAIVFRDLTLVAVVTAFSCSMLVLAPQIIINMVTFGVFTPLITHSLYADQLQWGAQFVKYTTVLIPGISPPLFYANPLLPPGITTAPAFIARSPFGYALTLVVHAFALVDQDYGFTYVTDLQPWYRWPVSILSYAIVASGCVGTLIGLRRYGRFRGQQSPQLFAFVAVVVLSGAYLTVYLPTAVESRFGIPLLLLLMPGTLQFLRDIATGPRGPRIAIISACMLAGVGVCVGLSLWLETLQLIRPAT